MTIEIEDAIERFAAANAHGGDRALNVASYALADAIKRNRDTIPASAVPDLSIPGLSIEVWICTRCGRYRIEHYVAALSGRKDACDAFTLEDLSGQESPEPDDEQDGAQPSAIEALRNLLSSMTGARSDWDATAAKHREDADPEKADEDWLEAASKSDRIRYEQAEEDAGMEVLQSLPGWIEQLELVLARLDLTKEL